MADLSFEISLQPKQRRLLEMMETGTATVLAWGGARGGSKSFAARAINLIRRLRYPKTASLIFRRTQTELLNNHILPTFQQWPVLRQHYNATEKLLTLPNGSTTMFLSADDERGFNRLQGAEFADVFVDEASHNSLAQIQWLRTTNRCTTNPDIQPRMLLTMNPGGQSHAALKRLFIDRQYRENERPDDYAFLQAFGHDNVEWSRPALEEDGLTVAEYYRWPEQKRFEYFVTRTDYGRILSALPRDMREANLLGRWDVYSGQYFDCFDPARHVVSQKRAAELLRPHHLRWLSGDYGFHDTACFHWHALLDDGTAITYRELATNRTTPHDLGTMLAEATPANEKLKAFFFSPDAFGERSSQRTIAHEIAAAMRPYGLPAPSRADNDRVGGWALLYQILQPDPPKWLISENCRLLIESLPQLQRQPFDKNPNDVADEPHEFTDAPESARYGLKTFLKSAAPPVEDQVAKAMTAIDPNTGEPDFTRRMLQASWMRASLDKARGRSIAMRRLKYGRLGTIPVGGRGR